ncbi:hypothetical protein [Citrobacter freundii]
MKPTYEELEKKLEESRREFRAADATIHNLELKLTDMAVQLANAERKCRELAGENAGLKNPENWLSQSDYGYEASEVATQNGATEDESLRAGMIAIINRIGTPATDAFLAEVRASALEYYANLFKDTVNMDLKHNQEFHKGTLYVADQFRKGVQS